MFLFTVLILILLIITFVVVLAISTIGASAIIIFGDVIVCIFIIAWIISLLIKRRR